MPNMKNLIGQQFDRLEVIAQGKIVKSGKRYRYYWICKCECGGEIEVRTDCLTSKTTRSCGCLHKESAIENVKVNHKHKMTGSRLYHTWNQLKGRCYNKSNNCYYRYGGRGIQVCDEWRNDFESFYNWSIQNGYNENLTIDRINNNGNYEPNNCRWATNKTQCRNRRTNVIVHYGGRDITLIELSEIVGLKYTTLHARYQKGYSIDDMIKPI